MKTLLTILLLSLTIAANAQKWNSLVEKAESLREKGKPFESIECAQEARALMLENNEAQNPMYLKATLILAEGYSKTGDHQKSLASYKQALGRLAANTGKGTEYAKVQILAAMEQASCGNYAKAMQMLGNSEEIITKAKGNQCEDLVLYYSALASLCAMQGNVGSELDAAAKLCALSEMHYSEHSAGRLAGYEHLAILCHNLGRYQEAIDNYQKALPILEKNYGKKSAQYAKCLHYLGNSYCRNLQHSEAIECLSQACKILENSLGSSSTDLAEALHALSEPYYQARNYSQAYASLKKALEIYNNRLRADFQFLTTRQRENYWKSISSIHDNLLAILIKNPGSNGIAGDAYNSLLMAKSLLLASEISLSRIVLGSGDSTLINLYKSTIAKRQQLEMLPRDSGCKKSSDSLEALISSREQELMLKAARLGEIAAYTRHTWGNVQEKLEGSDLAVEFFISGNSLGALVLKQGFSEPKLVMLENPPASAPYTSTEMYQKIWQPILKHSQPGARIYFAPAGMLHTTAIEYAPASDTAIVSDIYEMHRLSTTRNIGAATKSTQPGRAAVYGGIFYDTDLETMKSESSKYSLQRPEGENRKISERMAGLSASYLKGTLAESRQVCQYLDSMKFQTQYFSERQANEESFKSLSGKQMQIIHIATHGFYINDYGQTPDEALINSGLLFSGCNNISQVPGGIDDGILTASEISGLDLRGTKLLVLSACETGLGEITPDGVFGLQRGFKKAGVNTIIMSLWPVSDNTTVLLMSNFYKNLSLGLDYRAAFAKSQQSLRQKKGITPRHWAAFIMLD